MTAATPPLKIIKRKKNNEITGGKKK